MKLDDDNLEVEWSLQKSDNEVYSYQNDQCIQPHVADDGLVEAVSEILDSDPLKRYLSEVVLPALDEVLKSSPENILAKVHNEREIERRCLPKRAPLVARSRRPIV